MSPTLSVIIATYNRENLVIQTLNSIKNQTYKDFECIIVNDQSTDNTFNVISDFIKSDNRFTLYSISPVTIYHVNSNYQQCG